MRSLKPVIAGLLAAVALTGCTATVPGTPAAAPGPAPTTVAAVPSPAPGLLGTAYADPQGRFRITPPKGWRIGSSGTAGVAVLFSAPTRTGSFSSGLSVYVVDSALPLDALVVGARSELRGLTAYASTTDEAVILTDGTPAHLLGGTYRDLAGDLDLRNVQLFTVHAGRAIAVTATSLAAEWVEHEPGLRAALVSITFAS